MIATSKDAGKMWCPLTMSRPKGGDSCLGSICMAWRWFDLPIKPHVINYHDRDAETEPSPRPAHVPEGYIWQPADDEGARASWFRPDGDSNRRGFCGMAGGVRDTPAV